MKENIKNNLLDFLALISYCYLIIVVFLPNLVAHGFLEAVKIVVLEDPFSIVSLLVIAYFSILKLLDGFKRAYIYNIIAFGVIGVIWYIVGFSRISLFGHMFSAPLMTPLLWPYEMIFTPDYIKDIMLLQFSIAALSLLFYKVADQILKIVTIQIFLGGLLPTFQPLLSTKSDGVVDISFVLGWFFQDIVMAIIYSVIFIPLLLFLVMLQVWGCYASE